jgi:hypothetical protein
VDKGLDLKDIKKTIITEFYDKNLNVIDLKNTAVPIIRIRILNNKETSP